MSLSDEELLESCREGLRRHEERLAAMTDEERANLELLRNQQFGSNETIRRYRLNTR